MEKNLMDLPYGMEGPDELSATVRRLREALAAASTDLDGVLRLRGYRIHSAEPVGDVLVPGDGSLRDEYYARLMKYSFRIFLRDVIKHQRGFRASDVSKYAAEDATGGYMEYLLAVGLIEEASGEYRLIRRIRSFGATLEWFVAEVLRREFRTEAVWGVKFKGKKACGDYDVIARPDGILMYVEVKSSPPKQVFQKEIAAFLARVEDLRPEISVFLMDTELRMKDKIVPMFEQELAARFVSPPRPPQPPQVERLYRELFSIGSRMFIINSKGGIDHNLERVLARYFRGRSPLEPYGLEENV